MDKKILKGLIDEKLEVIQEQFSIIRAYEGKIPIIELDIIMGNIRDLYELILSLQLETLGDAVPKPEPRSEIESTPVITPVTPEETVELAKPVPQADPEPASPGRFSPGILSMEPVREEHPAGLQKQPPPAYMRPFRPDPEPVAVPVRNEPEPAPPPPIPPEPADDYTEPPVHEQHPSQERTQRTTFDLFSDTPTLTIADRLRDGQDKRLADKFHEHKIVDLRSTIGINDKFLFINELFDGDMRLYDDIIQKLNSGTTMAQIDLLLLDLKIAYNWDSEAPTVKKFVELVRRKF